MNNLIITIGISGSGKSTWSSNFLKNNLNYLRINRDDIRKTMVGSLEEYYTRKDLHQLEAIVSDIEEQLFMNYGSYVKSVIVDNTNLNQKVIKSWIKHANYYNYDINFKLFDCELREAQQRVFERDYWDNRDNFDKVKYIEKQYKQYQLIKEWVIDNYKKYII